VEYYQNTGLAIFQQRLKEAQKKSSGAGGSGTKVRALSSLSLSHLFLLLAWLVILSFCMLPFIFLHLLSLQPAISVVLAQKDVEKAGVQRNHSPLWFVVSLTLALVGFLSPHYAWF
jgi:hypothetical protein